MRSEEKEKWFKDKFNEIIHRVKQKKQTDKSRSKL